MITYTVEHGKNGEIVGVNITINGKDLWVKEDSISLHLFREQLGLTVTEGYATIVLPKPTDNK